MDGIIEFLIQQGKFVNEADFILQHPKGLSSMFGWRYRRAGCDKQNNKVRFCWAGWDDMVFVWKETLIGRGKYRRVGFKRVESAREAKDYCQRQAEKVRG